MIAPIVESSYRYCLMPPSKQVAKTANVIRSEQQPVKATNTGVGLGKDTKQVLKLLDDSVQLTTETVGTYKE